MSLDFMMDSLVCVQDFETRALEILDRNAGNYFKSGSDDEVTLRENTAAFSRWLIRPRMMRDVSVRNLKQNVLGKPVSFPVGIAPTAFQSLAHPLGEILNAKAAASMGTIFVLSTFSNWSIEDVAREAPDGRKWFQLFPNTSKDVTQSLIHRAEVAGYEAIVVTLDAQNFGKKRNTMREPFQLPSHLKIANLQPERNLKKENNTNNIPEPEEHISKFVHENLAQNLTWETVSWIKSITKLPLILKGILTEEDAKLAIKQEVDGIWVSNHGGRQIDTAIPTIDALPAIVKVVNKRCEIYVDSGVRRGSDVFKAIALGATMVFVGRPPIWGIAVAGEAGAKKVLQILKDELDLTMALTGVVGVQALTEDYVQNYSVNSKL